MREHDWFNSKQSCSRGKNRYQAKLFGLRRKTERSPSAWRIPLPAAFDDDIVRIADQHPIDRQSLAFPSHGAVRFDARNGRARAGEQEAGSGMELTKVVGETGRPPFRKRDRTRRGAVQRNQYHAGTET